MDDDLNSLLSRDFGFKPQGKSAPMAPPRNTNTFSSVNFGLGSAPIFDDHTNGNRNGNAPNSVSFNDVYGAGGGPHKQRSSSSSSIDYESVFKDQNVKTTSLPVFDKPVYDDDDHVAGDDHFDIFNGLPGLKSASIGPQSSSSANYNDVFASIGSSPPRSKHQSFNNNSNSSSSSPFDELLVNLGKKENESKKETVTSSAAAAKDSDVFDELLSGFGSSNAPSMGRSSSESSRPQKPSGNAAKKGSNMIDDPFVVLESTAASTTSSGLYTDPLEDISKFSSSGSTKVDSSNNRGIFDDTDIFDNFGKSVPQVSSGTSNRGKDRSPLRTGPSMGDTFSATSKEPVDKYPVDEVEGFSQKKVHTENFQEPHEKVFDMSDAASDFHGSVGQNVSSPPYADSSPNEANSPPAYEDISETTEDIWLTVSEVPLFTEPTSAPPPSRPPPPRPPRKSKSESSYSSTNSRKKVNEYSFANSTYSQSPRSAHDGRSSVPSPLDELEAFAMGRTPSNASEHADVPCGEDMDVNGSSAAASAAAMKEAMDKAEAKFRQMREREHLKAARSRESGQLDKDLQEAQQRESKERQERLQREREEEERQQRRLERERERAREIEREREEKEREQRRLERENEQRERERERLKARQAVERATHEARERAAAEARLKAERAAVEKAASEARQRAERAAVQRAQAEARERAAAEARERAERAAAEAREREARERAAVARAEADARQRAERAAVERAAAEARQRAAAAARANQQRNESQQSNDNDFDSFFTSRASSAPRPRNNSDPFFDTQTKGASEAARRTSVGTASTMKKASSTTNFVDDLSSIFGGTANSGDFQEVEGETEERRRARLERHQRTQERAAKALAEKNQRDLEAQREQAERHRIAETLDVEIKRWAAGKEGNLRALLSTLQYVLWPDSGWQPVSLTDLITGASVKKVYRKATLCIHPDKVQQKGATLQQKYIAEKVFDLLKEAWNKFNSEELF